MEQNEFKQEKKLRRARYVYSIGFPSILTKIDQVLSQAQLRSFSSRNRFIRSDCESHGGLLNCLGSPSETHPYSIKGKTTTAGFDDTIPANNKIDLNIGYP